MEPLLSRVIVQAAPRIPSANTTSSSTRTRVSNICRCSPFRPRPFPLSSLLLSSPSKRHLHPSLPSHLRERQKPYDTQTAPDSSHSQPAAAVSQNVTRAEEDAYHGRLQDAHRQLQTQSPWTREGSDLPPVSRARSAGAMTKGKLLTTPSRMLTLILPLTTRDWNHDRKDVEPLALLVHPQQPLSYLERLVQSELPMVEDANSGKERAPRVVFRAEDSMEESITDGKDEDGDGVRDSRQSGEGTTEKKEKKVGGSEEEVEEKYELRDGEEEMRDGKLEKTGKIGGGLKAKSEEEKKGEEKDKEVMKADGFPDDDAHPTFVRWSPSTEIGDFIRDAARGKEFAVDIEGAPEPIYVGVPSFADRTYYLRMRLRKTATRISQLADIKKDCDKLAQLGAKRLAQSGFVGLIGWWGAVYYLTFKTELGWDVMEPVTYLVGLSGLIGGYMWFLYHNREVSYRSAMHFTVSRRQSVLYEQKGFNLPQWEMLVEEGNRLRREIKLVAEEYDVDWDETSDEGGEDVREALRKERRKKREEDGEDKSEGKKEKDDD